MTWFVLVPGACHGGWWYAPVVEALLQAGHTADAVTLSGLDPQGSAAPAANLDVHIDEVAALLQASDRPAVLVGHSYAGSVITGVADRLPDRIASLLYLDAFVPEDGDSCWSMTNDDQRRWYSTACGATGLGVEPLPFFDGRARPHPLGTLMQRSRLTGAYKSVGHKHYAAAAAADWLTQSPFTAITERLRHEPGWTVTDLDSGHNILAHGPKLLLDLLHQHATM